MGRGNASIEAERIFNEQLMAMGHPPWQESDLFVRDSATGGSDGLTVIAASPESAKIVFWFDDYFQVGIPEFGEFIWIDPDDFSSPQSGVAASTRDVLTSTIEIRCSRWLGWPKARLVSQRGEVVGRTGKLGRSSIGLKRGEVRTFRPVLEVVGLVTECIMSSTSTTATTTRPWVCSRPWIRS